jgi:hypothetical protein
MYKCIFFFAIGVYLIGSRLFKTKTYLGGAVINESDPFFLRLAVMLIGVASTLIGFYCLSL